MRLNDVSKPVCADDPQRLKSSTSEFAGSAAFTSHTDRRKKASSSAVADNIGDPGAYELAGHLSVSKQASASFLAASKKGASGFGGTSKRELRLNNRLPTSPGTDDDVTPAPGAYEPAITETGKEHSMSTRNGAETMKSSSFASTSKRKGVVLPQAANPGAGAYSPDYMSQEPRQGNLLSQLGRDHKFVSDNLDGMGDDSNTQAHVGPGSYNSHVNGTILDTVEKAGHSLSASVISEVGRPLTADLW